MDENNNGLEITATNAMEPVALSTNQFAAVGGGIALGLLAGILIDKFIIGPAIKKYGEKKASKKEADKTDDKAES